MLIIYHIKLPETMEILMKWLCVQNSGAILKLPEPIVEQEKKAAAATIF